MTKPSCEMVKSSSSEFLTVITDKLIRSVKKENGLRDARALSTLLMQNICLKHFSSRHLQLFLIYLILPLLTFDPFHLPNGLYRWWRFSFTNRYQIGCITHCYVNDTNAAIIKSDRQQLWIFVREWYGCNGHCVFKTSLWIHWILYVCVCIWKWKIEIARFCSKVKSTNTNDLLPHHFQCSICHSHAHAQAQAQAHAHAHAHSQFIYKFSNKYSLRGSESGRNNRTGGYGLAGHCKMFANAYTIYSIDYRIYWKYCGIQLKFVKTENLLKLWILCERTDWLSDWLTDVAIATTTTASTNTMTTCLLCVTICYGCQFAH